MEVDNAFTFFMSELHGVDCSALPSNIVTPGERAFGPQWIEGWVAPKLVWA